MADDRYEPLHAAFRWQVPPDFNLAEACCGRWARATPKATASKAAACRHGCERHAAPIHRTAKASCQDFMLASTHSDSAAARDPLGPQQRGNG